MTTMIPHSVLTALVLMLTLGLGAEEVTGTVTGTLLHVRTKPNRRSETLCLLNKDDTVTVTELKGEWLGIKPPRTAKAWIPTSAIKDRMIAVDRVDIRSGPGQVFTAYGSLKKGDLVTVKRVKHMKWAEIQPPTEGLVWTHGDFVSLPKEFAQKRAALLAKAEAPKQGEPDKSDKDSELVKIVKPLEGRLPKSVPIKPPQDLKVHALVGEPDSAEINTIGMAKTITRSGVIIKLPPNKKRPWRYALAAQINNVFYPLFYIGNEFKTVEKWEWHRVKITGEQNWIRGWPRPLVEVKQVQELPD